MNIFLSQLYIFWLILIGVAAVVTFMMSRIAADRPGNTFIELIIWEGSLMACAGGDYFLIALNGNPAWI